MLILLADFVSRIDTSPLPHPHTSQQSESTVLFFRRGLGGKVVVQGNMGDSLFRLLRALILSPQPDPTLSWLLNTIGLTSRKTARYKSSNGGGCMYHIQVKLPVFFFFWRGGQARLPSVLIAVGRKHAYFPPFFLKLFFLCVCSHLVIGRTIASKPDHLVHLKHPYRAVVPPTGHETRSRGKSGHTKKWERGGTWPYGRTMYSSAGAFKPCWLETPLPW